MYIPKAFRNVDKNQLHEFIEQYNFSTIITYSSGFQVSHIPLILVPEIGEYGVLIGHMARANGQLKNFKERQPVLCIFHGPHAYISPSWYEDNKPEVPTWNYVVVQASGIPQLIEDEEEILKIVDKMIDKYEPALQDPSSKNYIPQEFKLSQLKYIVAFKIEITELIGKYKLSQNRTLVDQNEIIEGLNSWNDGRSLELASFMKSYLKLQ